MTTEITTTGAKGFDLSPQNFEQALTFSKYLSDSDMVPKDFKGKPANCLIAMQWGYELGMQPLQAIQNIAVINGRPAMWGDAVIALVRSSPLCEYVQEADDGNTATCRVKRRGEPEQIRSFSVEDARAAGLAGKQGPWSQYPKRMRQLRARAFALRDVFPDVLRGMPVAEEVMDTPTEKFMGAADVVHQQPAAGRPALPASYPEDAFADNLPKWRAAIQAGKATAEQIVARASTKGQLTDEQQAAIRAPIEAAPAQQQPDADGVIEQPAMTYAQVADRLYKAGSMDQLADAGSCISLVQDADHRHGLADIYDQRAAQLEG